MGCQTHHYYKGSYDSATEFFKLRSSNLTSQSLTLSCFKKDAYGVERDDDMCTHLSQLFEEQGAAVSMAGEDEDHTSGQSPSSKIKLDVTSSLKWKEDSNWDKLFHYASYGCYPISVKRWYETEISITIDGRLIGQKNFKAQWNTSTSWCLYLFEEGLSVLPPIKSSSDFMALNTQDFDRFISEMAYSAKRHAEWIQPQGDQRP